MIAALAAGYSSTADDGSGLLVIVGVSAAVCAFIGGAIGSGKRMGGGAGSLLGLLLGPLGVIVVAVSAGPTALERVQSRPAAAGWFDDPLGRFDSRYYDGQRWTQHVGKVEADGRRRQLEDPI